MEHWPVYTSILLSFWIFVTSGTLDEQSLVNYILNHCDGDTEASCVLEAQNALTKWLNKNNLYTVLVAGKTGTGKTRLIKGFAENITEVSREQENNLFPGTVKVESYKYVHEGRKIYLFDSPGLVDTETNEEGKDTNYDYLQDMVRSVSPDVIVFFVKMEDSVKNTLDHEDVKVITNISNAFGWHNWRYTMFVLSFANRVINIDAQEGGDEDDQHFFTTRLAQLRLHIKKLLRTLMAGNDTVREIPIIPVGLVNEEKFVADVREISWVEEFWTNLFAILKRSEKEKKSLVKNMSVLPDNNENLVTDAPGKSWFDGLYSMFGK